MSQALKHSLSDIIDESDALLHLVKSSGLDFNFDQEQIAFRIEAMIFELKESIDSAVKLSELEE